MDWFGRIAILSLFALQVVSLIGYVVSLIREPTRRAFCEDHGGTWYSGAEICLKGDEIPVP